MVLPMIEWSIRAGDLLTILAFLGGGVAAYFALKGDVRILKHDFASMKLSVELLSSAMKGFSDVLVKLAVTETRMAAMEEDVRELRHGRGFIRGNRSSVDGEYPS